ncbi:hypothetical protein CONLIGDRAFT_638177 [Coniochaeta ligniaria NRRL 30616]|uniref:Cyanovirin-N domain-containing protein n=1 Tax=Coniochaeta ligniaria NRRL 30616 TaxID=1408157 RepID=A0A1J7IY80_9PEZI|nr:hypothetical protein CONLIGDRAFT_638177 [Coniochaeta ligniaria NRRL 30616]
MPTYTILVLTLSLSAVIGAFGGPGTVSRAEQAQCLTWGGNATTSVFHNCCKQVTLETSPRLALTALCPNRISDFDPSLFPDGQYTFSWLPLDECLHLHDGQHLVTVDDITPMEALEL